nr:PREDICTED: sickle tail protein homolog isoform X4 [Lepisosteus oculatus]
MSGNRVQFADLPPQNERKGSPKLTKQGKSNLRVTSPEDAEHLSKKQGAGNGSNRTDSKPSRNIPRRHTVGGPRSSREILGMQPSDMDKKREAFLEHLKQKYPHHASAIMGHQERLREQAKQCMLASLHSELDIQRYLLKIESSQRSRSPKHAAGEQAEHPSGAAAESGEVMSEGEAPAAFTRGSRSRASLPVVRSTNQTKDRSLGVLYLQYGDETKQMRMPNEITSADTIRALFVSAFPQQLTMKMLESPNVAVYIKDDMRNMYYELSDVRNITAHSCLKVYHKDPVHAFSHSTRPANGDVRMHREVVYTTREAQHAMRQTMGPPPPHAIQSPLPPPSPLSMPPSPSRIPYGPRAMVMPGSATVPRDRLASIPPSRSISPCPSAILERRDVKPDEDMGNKSVALARGDGLYADPYMLHEGRLSIASSHGGHVEVVDHSMGFPRGSIRSTSSYASSAMTTELMEHQTLYRQKSKKYSDSHLPTLGSKTPPPSPHRMTDVRLMEIHPAQNAHVPQTVQLERSSPVRQSFKKDAGGSVAVETVTKTRSNMASPVVPDIPLAHGDKPLLGHGAPASPSDPQTRERMKAMEQQIASLTGLVQHALFKGPNTSGAKDPVSEKPASTASPGHNGSSGGGSSAPSAKSTVSGVEATALAGLPAPSSPTPVQVNLISFRKNVSDLRLQLHQMKQLQLQNQEALRAMLKRAEQEIGARLAETLKRHEDPVQRQRVLVEEERQSYLGMEERILGQLCELEGYVDELKKDSASATVHRAVTLKDVEDGAVNLRKVGESLATLKGEFPALQGKMRAVLRVEVEAVKFLKEEPHKLDSMLKRVKTLTEILSGLRRYATDNLLKGSEPAQVKTTLAESVVSFTTSESLPAVGAPPQEQPAPRPPSPTGLPEPQSSSVKSEVMPASPVVIHHVQSSPVHIQQSQHSAALFHRSGSPPAAASPAPCLDSPPLLARGGPQSPTPGGPPGQEAGAAPVQQQRVTRAEQTAPASPAASSAAQSLFIEEIHTSRSKHRDRAVTIEAAEKEWEEKRQNMGHYDGREFEKLLQEAQANMMRGIPDLEVAAEAEAPAVPPLPRQEEVDSASSLGQPSVEEAPYADTSADKAGKSPPPPPPRRSYPPGSGLTTGRSGEVIFTSRKDAAAAQAEAEEEGTQGHNQPSKVSSESRVVTRSPPPAAASAVPDEEDEGGKILAELQVFQKCTFTDVGAKSFVEHTRVDPQVRELRPGALTSPREKKQSVEVLHEEKQSSTDENGNDTVLQTQGVIYYVTGQLPKELPAVEMEDHKERREFHSETTLSSSQVASVNAYEISESQQLGTDEIPVLSERSLREGQETFYTPEHQVQIVYTESHQEDGYLAEAPRSIPQLDTGSKEEHCVEIVSHQVSVDKHVVSVSVEEGGFRNEMLVAAEGPLVLDRDASPTPESVQEGAESECSQQVVMRPSKGRVKCAEEAESNSSSPSEEFPSPTDNIAFMITDTKVQALSCGEYEEIVNTKGENIQTVNVDNNKEMTTQDNSFDKKPVIIIFDEPMDIRSAYKRLSTIFECEEELERMLAEERIEEENEDAEDVSLDRKDCAGEGKANERDGILNVSATRSDPYTSSMVKEEHGGLQDPLNTETDDSKSEFANDGKQDAKKKFKFKFPKKQLAALTQAIRTGTKTGKKTLQVVVYEEEEELDGTVKQQKEAKRFEISRTKPKADSATASLTAVTKNVTVVQQGSSDSHHRTDEIRKNTYKTLDSLEQTIKQLETTISEMGPRSPEETSFEESKAYSIQMAESLGKDSPPEEHNSMQELPPPVYQPHKAAHHKKHKPQLLPRPAAIPTTSDQSTSVTTSTSRMPVPMSAKSRQQPGGSEKAGKQQKLQDPQRQFRQANGSAKKAGGDYKATSPPLPASKIPAFSSSSGKSSTLSASSSDATNPVVSSSKSSIPSPSLLNSHATRSAPHHPPAPTHIPSLSNGSLKPQSPTHTGKGHNLSFSPQNQNGRPPPSSSFSPSSSYSPSAPSPVSHTSLSQGAKSIRTIHTPSFISYKPQNGNSSKSSLPSSSSSKDAA